MALKIFLPSTLETMPLWTPQPTQPTLVAMTAFAKIYIQPDLPKDEIRIQAGLKTITCKVKK